MKRQSKAEEALQKQVKILLAKESDLCMRITQLNTELGSHGDIRRQLEKEIYSLRSAREASSILNKPKATS